MLSKCRIASRAAITVQKDALRLISSKEVIDREEKYAAHNYHPLPAALSKGKGQFYVTYSIR